MTIDYQVFLAVKAAAIHRGMELSSTADAAVITELERLVVLQRFLEKYLKIWP